MKNEELHLVLGCFGRRDDDFINCLGIENKILLLTPILFKYSDLMDYLDGCRLFDRPMFDVNAIRHVIFNLRDKFDQPTSRLWSEKKFNLYQKFLIDHRHCGLYIKLVLVIPELEESPPKDLEKITIVGTSEENRNLRLIKGR